MKDGLALAKSVGAKVTVLTVQEQQTWPTLSDLKAQQSFAEHGVFLDLGKYLELHKEYLSGVLSRAESAAKQAGVSCDTVQMEGVQPYRAIVETAADRGCDLIVMSSHGRSGLSAVLVGSVTNKVLVHTKTPVLVCR